MIKVLTLYRLSPDLMAELNELERFQGAWEAKVSEHSPHFIKELKQTSIITSSGASTRIEGAQLSDKEVAELVSKGCKISTMSSRSEREVSGYVKALRYIYDHYRDLPLSEHTIRELHQLLTSDLLEEHLPSNQRGIYKTIPNDVVEKNNDTGEEKVWFRTTPPGPQTEAQMQSLVEDLNLLMRSYPCRPLIVAGFAVAFLAIHPFRDGNGRLSRLLTTFLLLKSGYDWAQYTSHEKVIEDNKTAYYIHLRNTQVTLQNAVPEFDDWFSFFVMVLNRQSGYLKTKITQESPKAELNSNEAKVYEVIKAHGKVTPAFLLGHVEMTSDGLKSLLQRLVAQGLIIPEGERRGRKYRIKL